jgi:hypothetical protein
MDISNAYEIYSSNYFGGYRLQTGAERFLERRIVKHRRNRASRVIF